MSLGSEQMVALRAQLESETELCWAYLFGSAARGEPHRDVDVAVMPRRHGHAADGKLGVVDLGVLVSDLEARLGATVDLVDLRSAPLPLAGPMLRERVVVLDRRPVERQTWEAETTSRWLDFRPAYERFSAERRSAFRRRMEQAG